MDRIRFHPRYAFRRQKYELMVKCALREKLNGYFAFIYLSGVSSFQAFLPKFSDCGPVSSVRPLAP
jgi:hypothetical protein